MGSSRASLRQSPVLSHLSGLVASAFRFDDDGEGDHGNRISTAAELPSETSILFVPSSVCKKRALARESAKTLRKGTISPAEEKYSPRVPVLHLSRNWPLFFGYVVYASLFCLFSDPAVVKVETVLCPLLTHSFLIDLSTKSDSWTCCWHFEV